MSRQTTQHGRNRVLYVGVAAALLGGWAVALGAQSVVIYQNPHFGGHGDTLGIGDHRFANYGASSIRVPKGLVAVLYANADDGGGYGVSVDLLEDHDNLSAVNFPAHLSYVTVFSSKNPNGFVWSRSAMRNGQFVAGHWERERATGTAVNAVAVVSPPLPPHPPGARPSAAGGVVVRDHRVVMRVTPASVLQTTYKNPPFNTSKPTWATDVVRGKTMFPDFFDVNIIPETRVFSSPDYSKNEWTQILSPDEDYDLDAVGVSGRAILLGRGISGADVPFTHPFSTDWEFYIAPDADYQSLAAPPAPPPNTHPEYAQSVTIAKNEFDLDVVNTLGVEVEAALVPELYRVQHGDRVAVWGRWIVDTGHPDFHTEIHPPLLLATARATSQDETMTTVIGRPYLVGQRWRSVLIVPTSDPPLNKPKVVVRSLGMIDHLLEEADKIPLSSLRAEAHPTIMPQAFTGLHLMTFTVRPPSPRNSPADQLMATFHFTVRTGVVVQVVNAGDAVSVVVSMNDKLNKRAPLPTKHDRVITRDELKAADPRAGQLYLGKEIENGITSAGIGAALLARGVLTDHYDAPIARSASDSRITHVLVSSLSGNTPFSVDDSQPFPIYGRLTLTWERH